MKKLNSLKLQLLIFGVLIAVFYGNTLFNDFVHDDIWQVAENKYVKNVSNIPAIFTSCIAEDILGGCRNKGFYYRPLQSVVYAIVYQVSSKPWLFHLANLVYLLIISLLVFHLFSLIISKTTPGVVLGLVGTVLFLAHPINSEVINWVSATPELLTTIFMMLAIILYDKFRKKSKIYYLLFSALSYFLALLAKETALFLLPLLPLYEFLFSKPQKGQGSFKRFSFISWHLGAVGLYLSLREEALGRVIYKYAGYYSMDTYTQVINALTLLPKYLWKLIYPLPLSFQPQILPVSSFGLMGWLGVFICAAAVLASFFLWKKKKKGMLFGLALILLPLFPILVFINKLGENLFSERYLFLSSIGFSLIAVEICRRLLSHTSGRSSHVLSKIPVAVLLVFLGVGWWVVFNRNKDWKDNSTSYQSMIRVNPNHTKAHFQLGEYYLGIGEFSKAQEELKRVLSLDPNYPGAQKRLDMSVQRYNAKTGLSFYQPAGFKVVEDEHELSLYEAQNRLNIRISLEKVKGSKEEYLSGQTEKFGVLNKEGLGSVPNFDQTVVRVWQDPAPDGAGQVAKLQFFLFKGDQVVKILVYPADSPLMEQFNLVLGSIRIH
ncbi:hypothetical protein HYW46_00925 [Candidatus Daviesbacteria bacterium]|nr:hypothetical protein [Candidatus Daviesbacteria bacterium]